MSALGSVRHHLLTINQEKSAAYMWLSACSPSPAASGLEKLLRGTKHPTTSVCATDFATLHNAHGMQQVTRESGVGCNVVHCLRMAHTVAPRAMEQRAIT